MWETSTDVFVLKTRIYPFLVFDLAYSHLRTKRASNFYFVACSTNKLTKIRQFNSQVEQYRTVSSFWVRVRTKNPTAKKPQQLGIKAGAGMEGRGMTVHSRGEKQQKPTGRHTMAQRECNGIFCLLITAAYMPTASIWEFVFIYCFPMIKV